jgi:hypothetical protein
MSQRTLCTSNAILGALGGAVAGVYAWQHMMSPAALSVAASGITTDLVLNQAVLASLDRKDYSCAQKLRVDRIESSLDVSVPGALEWRIDEQFREQLETTANESRRYLESRQREGYVAQCNRESRSNPLLNAGPLKRPG